MADDRRVLETRQIFETDESYFQEGRQRWIHTVKVPVHDEASGLCGILGIFWDVTDQRILEEKLEQYRKDLENTVQIRTAALQETEERFRVAATVITNLIWEWNIETGAMTWFGETLDQSGFSPQELPGTFEAWQRFIHPEDRPKVAQAIEAQIANGEAYRVEYRMTHRGSIPRIWMDRGKVLRDVAGKAVKMIGACIDITRQKLAEKAIRETGTKFRSLFDLSRDGIVYANLGGYFEDANPAFLQMIGYTLPELRKLTFKDITPGKWLHIETELVRRQLFSNGFTELFEKEYVRKDQTVFSVEVTIMCVRDSGGTPIRLWAIIRDITDRKLMENWLKENKHRLEMALRGANLGTWDWYPTTRKVLFNDKWAEILGLFLDEIPPHLDSIHSRLHPEDFPKYQERMNRHLAQETPYYESEHRMRHKNGDWHWVYECGRVVETDEQGKPLRVTGISRDITSRKQTEMALRETMSMYQSLAEASQDLIYVIDAGERISYVNTRAVQAMGSTLGEIIGRPLSSLFPPESVGKLQDNLHRVMTTGAPLLAEDELMVGSKALWLSSWLVPLTSGDQENHGVHAVLGVSRDISSQKKADLERQHYLLEVQKSNEELQQFAYIASHDLQEPLRSISGHLSLLEKRYQKAFDEQGLRSLHFAVDGAARMRDLIQALLSYARIGTQKIDVVRVDFARVIEQVKIDLEYTITQHQAQITHGELPTLTVSKNQMVQLFGNLVGNAIKFKRKDTPPIIEIAAVATAEGWKFSVKDNGIGIEPAYFDRIFKIFQKLHTREEYPGTGIGLSVCKRIVERHNGRIWVESEPGGGTTFFFTIRDTPEGSERS
jgi:PAS domain S-box-containing protein